MTRLEFINYLGEKYGIKQRELIEKDYLLQSLIKELSGDEFFRKNFIFKGGTCLIKAYLGYYRFSEDLDFTWKKQEIWKNKSRKQARKLISGEISKILELLDKISPVLGLEFKPDKKSPRYAQFEAGNIFATFKLWYKSALSEREEFIKLQVNFVERIKYEPKECRIKSLIGDEDIKEISFLFPKEEEVFSSQVKVLSYDVREILIEKVRAILTRKGIKARDFFDVYFITKFLGAEVSDYETEIMEKTLFLLGYEKYSYNLLEKQGLFLKFKLSEDGVLLKSPEQEFNKFLEELYPFLDQIITKIKKEIKS